MRFPDFQKNLDMKLYELRVSPVERGSLRNGRKLRRLVALDEPPAEPHYSAAFDDVAKMELELAEVASAGE